MWTDRASMIAALVNKGFATLTYEKVYAGRMLVDVGKVRITAAGLDALGESRESFSLGRGTD
jgi:hypothetical protein